MSDFEVKRNTHIIIKIDDINEYLVDGQASLLRSLLDDFFHNRELEKKPNNYYICNTDEPYAAEVLAAIKAGELSKVITVRGGKNKKGE